MRFVDRHVIERRVPRELQKAARQQTLGSDVDDLVLSAASPVKNDADLRRRQRTVDISRLHAHLHKRHDLIFHQRHQRRDDQRHAAPQKRRDLIANGLSRAGRHHGEGVPPADQRVDRFFLAGTEGRVAKIPLQDFQFFIHRFSASVSNDLRAYFTPDTELRIKGGPPRTSLFRIQC